MEKVLVSLGYLVHSLQKERGCTSVFLNSKGKLFEERLKKQFISCDEIIRSIHQSEAEIHKTKIIKHSQQEKLSQLVQLCLALPLWRKQTLNQSINTSDSISYYSHQIIGPLLQLMLEIALMGEGSNPSSVSAYNAFLNWKERIGLERAIVVRGLINQQFNNKEFLDRVNFLLSEQNNYQNIFFTLANPKQKQMVVQALEIFDDHEIKHIHTAIENLDYQAFTDLSPEVWFDTISRKIDLLFIVEKDLIETLREYSQKEKEATKERDKNSLSLNINHFGKYEKLVYSLQLFSGMSASNLNLFLKNAQVRQFNKGKLLFLEGEAANRLYVVLDGWVKIFKGTLSGEETILQMLSTGDAILESAVFLNTTFPVSAQVIKDATLLSIPAPLLREQIKNNDLLALNLLSSISHHSQSLIRQIENARLKSADERIGWFLLKLFLQQGQISTQVDLPYDKSLIASYLGMNRETFSRVLKRMKNKGFKVENDAIIIPKMNALCGFCDHGIADQCKKIAKLDCSKKLFEQ